LWSVKFLAVDNVSRHPSQIYEAILEGIILFIVLNYIFKKKIFAKPGIISALFLILYSLFRFLAEFFRVPDMQIGYLVFNLSMGQIVSIVFFSIGIYLFFKKKNES
jgi:phosphatidylglycerol:prolipoprotein diacylglycerol transferase